MLFIVLIAFPFLYLMLAVLPLYFTCGLKGSMFSIIAFGLCLLITPLSAMSKAWMSFQYALILLLLCLIQLYIAIVWMFPSFLSQAKIDFVSAIISFAFIMVFIYFTYLFFRVDYVKIQNIHKKSKFVNFKDKVWIYTEISEKPVIIDSIYKNRITWPAIIIKKLKLEGILGWVFSIVISIGGAWFFILKDVDHGKLITYFLMLALTFSFTFFYWMLQSAVGLFYAFYKFEKEAGGFLKPVCRVQ